MSHLYDLDIAAVRRVWTRFCESGDAGHLRDLPQAVAASWQRSHAHGVDPAMRVFPMSEPVPRWHRQERELLRLAESAIAPYRRELRDSRALLVVIGASGRVILREGSASTLRAADAIGSAPGALVLESVAGTNSAGTTLHRKDATWIHRWAHYCEAFWHWSDVGAPIIHPVTGETLGLVDIGLVHDTVTPALALATKAIAGNIQREILQCEQGLRQTLIERWAQYGSGPHCASLAVDRNGAIVCASTGARRLLGGGEEPMRGSLFGAVPELRAIAQALESGRQGHYTIGLGGERQHTTVAVEPALCDDEIAGAIIHLEQPHARPRAPAGGWRTRYAFDEVLGQNPAFKAVVALARRLAPTDLPVLLHGETGTGKELLAHAIHAASRRAGGPFVTVNCGAIPHDLIASELFGYEKGAFTGANRGGQHGKFEQANGGTLFLDEITETGSALQVALLRVLQDGAVVPIGAGQARPIDVRIISATNRDPADAMCAGILRSDLYYRLNGAMLALPPLRERRDDIPRLVASFCAEAGADIDVSPEAMTLLLAYHWPGNLRELHAVIRSAAVLAEDGVIEAHDLPACLQGIDSRPARSPAARLDLKTAEVAAIERAMAATHGNVKEAARLLGVGRSSLYRKLKQLRMTRTSMWQSPAASDDT